MTQTAPAALLADRALPAAAALQARPHARAAEEFEALIAGEFAKLMLGTAGDGSGPFGGGHAEGIYRGMMADHIGNAIAARGGIGVAPVVMDQLIRLGNAE